MTAMKILTKMKRILLTFWIMLVVMSSYAQSWNPYVNQAITDPAPLLPWEFGGTGILSFNVGNSGSDALPLVVNQEMGLVITLSSGVPNNADPLKALGGTWLDYFNWTYDAGNKTYTGIQNKPIPGTTPAVPAVGTIIIQYKVTVNTSSLQPSNGFNVNVQPPDYTNGKQATGDDAASSYTYVRALDYGDAPASYGSAWHEINLFRDAGNTYYTNYVYLGASVDPEPANQPSDNADGDDLGGTDDENGVTFPTLTPGQSATIPVLVTLVDGDKTFNTYRLNAWIDWNGDGDFLDNGERIANNIGADYFSLGYNTTGTINVTVNVPVNATTQPTFARFRFGTAVTSPFNDPAATSDPVGEVEDYMIVIGCTPPSAPTGSLSITNSACTNCTLGGGTISLGTVSGTGGTLQFSTDGGTTWSTTLPVYDQDGPAQTIYASVLSPDGCRSGMILVGTTAPGVCTPANAGADQSVGCYSTGTVTMSATGTGTWSLGAGSAGTATITSPTSPTTTVTGFSAPGTYNLVWTTTNGCTDIAVITAGSDCACPITGNTITQPSPASGCAPFGGTTILGGAASPVGGTYLWEVNTGSGFMAAPGANNQQNYTTGTLTAGTYIYQRKYTTTSGVICSTYSNSVSITVYATPAPPTGTLAITNSTCTNCTLGGGTISLGTVSGTGGTLQFSTDGGATWSATLPAYDQDGPAQTIYASVLSPDGCRSATRLVGTTSPGTCTTLPAPVVSVIQPTCQTPTGTITITSPLGTGYTYSINGSVYQASPIFEKVLPGRFSVTAMNSQGCVSSPAVVVLQSPVCQSDLSILKTVDNSSAVPGSNVVFTLRVTNNGPASATGVVVTDLLPAGYTLVSAVPSAGSWSNPLWTIGTLTNGASVTLRLTARVNASGPYLNTALVEGNETDPQPGNNSDSDGIGTPEYCDLVIDKSVNDEIPPIGSNIIFTITVTNNGPGNATGIVVTDVLPSGYTFVGATVSHGTWTAPNWEIIYLRAGNSATLLLTATVNGSGNYVNHATVKGKQYDPYPGNNSDDAETHPMMPTLLIFNEYMAMCGESSLTGNILANGDRDQAGNSLTVNTTPVAVPQHGTVTIAANGAFTYTPDVGFEGKDMAVFQVCSSLLCRNDTLNLSVYGEITAQAGPDADLCGVTSVELKGNTYDMAQSAWKLISGPNTPVFSAPQQPVTRLSGLVEGTYLVEYSLTLAGCYDSDTVKVTIYDSPQASAGPDEVMCSGNSHMISHATASNYSSILWSHNGRGTLTGEQTLHPVYHAPADELGDVTLVMVVQPFAGGICKEVRDEMVLTVLPRPEITCPEKRAFTFKADPGLCGYVITNELLDADGDDYICDRINLHHNYSAWGNPHTLKGAFFPVGTTTVEWWAEACETSCHSDTCRITVTVVDEEPPQFINCPQGDLYTVGLWPGMCEGGAIWSIPVAVDNCSEVKVTQVNGPALGTILTTGRYNIRYQAEDQSGNKAWCAFQLEVIDSESPELICQPNLVMPSDPGGCGWKSPVNSLSPLMARSNCDFSITWSVTHPDGTTTKGMNDVSGHIFPVGENSVKYVIWEKNSNQADSCTFTVIVEDREAPLLNCHSPLTVTAPAGTCTARITLTPPGYVENCGQPVTISYKIFGPDNSLSGPFNWPLQPSGFMTGISQVIWTVIDQSGNRSVCTQQVTVIADNAGIKPDAGADAVICEGSTFTLNGTSPASGVTLEWRSNGTGSFSDPATLKPVYSPSAADILNGRVILSLTASSECASASDFLILTITPRPKVYAGPDKQACSGEVIPLDEARAEHVSSLTWTTSGKGELSGTNLLHPEYKPAAGEYGQILFILTGRGMSGCGEMTVSDTMAVSVAKELIVTASEDKNIMENRSAPLSVLVENGSGNYFYAWEPATKVLNQNGSSTETIPLTSDTRFIITVTDGITGCSARDTVNITVTDNIDDVLIIYNAISNNGDGINDVWLIDGIELFPDNVVMIFNRWGDKIREYYSYGKNGVFWDGTNNKGKKVPDGTYYYLLDIKNVKTYTGWIQVKSSF